ncbi:coiled-coil domain-containing protein 58 isoform X2 [Ooceraea biroi]|uniref:coiled-coil domain-containing protein 58 isoform X2 n=1 Tax=Ooceraea biroi TaxID=2015173 RepID=UPI0005BD1509|nr:coiled-coil domain-containing protein 58 isoform X2 [Ooceraea biroi]
MAAVNVDCSDFLEFQDTLKKMRLIDDKIIYLLNTTIPTESFKSQLNPTAQCKDLFQQIESEHSQRQLAIKKCLSVTKEKLMQLKNSRDSGDETPALLKDLRKQQTTLRLLQAELNIEEVVRKRTREVYHERCRGFYKPLHAET